MTVGDTRRLVRVRAVQAGGLARGAATPGEEESLGPRIVELEERVGTLQHQVRLEKTRQARQPETELANGGADGAPPEDGTAPDRVAKTERRTGPHSPPAPRAGDA